MARHHRRRDRRVFASPRHARRNLLGFTLIEVLVTIAIVGVLAAIAVPVYLTQRKHAAGTSVQAEVQSAAVAYEQAITAGAVTKSTAGDGSKVAQAVADYGYTPSQNNQTWVSVNTTHPEQFCVLGDSTSSSWTSGEYVYYDSTTRSTTDTQPTSGPCAGVEAATAYQLTATPDLDAQAVPLAGDNPTGPSVGPGVGPAGSGSTTSTDPDLLDAINRLTCVQSSSNPAPVLTGQQVITTGWNSSPLDAEYSPNGKFLAVSNNAGATVNNVLMYAVNADGTLRRIGGYSLGTNVTTFPLAFSPDGTMLAIADNKNFDVAMFMVGDDGTLTPAGTAATTTSQTIFGLDFSPNGKLLAVADGSSSKMFSVGAGGNLALVTSFGDSGIAARDVAFSPDGTMLAVADSSYSRISTYFVNPGGTLTPTVPANTTVGQATRVVWSPDGSLLAVGNIDGSGGYTHALTLLTVDSNSPADQLTTITNAATYALSFSPDGKLLAAGSFSTGLINLYKLNAGTPVPVSGSPYSVLPAGAGGYMYSTVFSPDGTHLVALSGTKRALFVYKVTEDSIC